jgi:peptidoglycan/LPS O-acetylase OafA/YrhL
MPLTSIVRRKDIDGLRFIAVTSVVVGHYFPSFMPSGYLGVDIFFVVSGYVITQLLCSMDRTRPFSLLISFYGKRMRRLAPALLTVVSITIVFCFLFITRTEGVISKTGAYSLIGLSNMYLWSIASNYFSLDASQNPFTHTWSLGVEEQFYLIYPLLFLLVFKVARKNRVITLVYSIGVISLFSLFLNLAFSQSKPNLVFYSMPTRLWELGIGAIVFLSTSRVHESLRGSKFRIIILSIMLLTFFVHFETLAIAQVVLTLITACLLIPNNDDSTSKFLSHKIATWIGVRSYSIYLIHWPLLVLTDYLLGHSLIKNFMCVLVTLFLSELNFSHVESPFREGRLKSTPLKTICFGAPILLLFTATIYYGAPKLSLSYNNLIPHLLGVKDVPNWNPTKCSGAVNTKKLENPIQQCLGGSKESSSRFVFLIGDSHADQLIPMSQVAFSSSKYEVRNLNLENGKDFPFGEIADNGSLSLKYLQSNTKKDDIVILTFHRGHLNPNRDSHLTMNEKISINSQTLSLIRNLNMFALIMEKKGVKIVLIKDTPLMNSIQTSQACALQLKILGRNGCKVSRTQDSHTRYLQEYAFEAVAIRNKNVRIYDPLNYIYQNSETINVLDSDGTYLMWDWNHITPNLSTRLGTDFKKFLDTPIVQ